MKRSGGTSILMHNGNPWGVLLHTDHKAEHTDTLGDFYQHLGLSQWPAGGISDRTIDLAQCRYGTTLSRFTFKERFEPEPGSTRSKFKAQDTEVAILTLASISTPKNIAKCTTQRQSPNEKMTSGWSAMDGDAYVAFFGKQELSFADELGKHLRHQNVAIWVDTIFDQEFDNWLIGYGLVIAIASLVPQKYRTRLSKNDTGLNQRRAAFLKTGIVDRILAASSKYSESKPQLATDLRGIEIEPQWTANEKNEIPDRRLSQCAKLYHPKRLHGRRSRRFSRRQGCDCGSAQEI